MRCPSLEERNELLQAGPGKFFITSHYDDYPAILVRLSQLDPGEMVELVTESWRICAPKRLLAGYDADHPPAPRPEGVTRRPTRHGQRMITRESRQ